MSLFCISACASPGLYPTGYTHHTGTPNVEPGEPANFIGYRYNKDQNKIAIEQWMTITESIIDEFEAEMGLAMPKDIILRGVHAQPAQSFAFEYALHSTLDQRGYNIFSDDAESHILRYFVRHQNPRANLTEEIEESPDPVPVYLTLHLMDRNEQIITRKGFNRIIVGHGIARKKPYFLTKDNVVPRTEIFINP